jgi:hypothetical protein
MESQTLINILGGAALSALGWFGRVLWEAVAELRKDLHEVEVDLPKNYVRRDEYSATMVRIEDMFQRIFDKLEHKQDK